jgi:hypothetical protein
MEGVFNMTMNNLELADIIRRLAEGLATEIVAEATAEDYEEALDSQTKDLTDAVVALQQLEVEVPYLVKEVLRMASDHRSKN